MLEILTIWLDDPVVGILLKFVVPFAAVFGVGFRAHSWWSDRQRNLRADLPVVRVLLDGGLHFGRRHAVFDLINQTYAIQKVILVKIRRPRKGILNRFVGHNQPAIGSSQSLDMNLLLPPAPLPNRTKGYELVYTLPDLPPHDAGQTVEFEFTFVRPHTRGRVGFVSVSGQIPLA